MKRIILLLAILLVGFSFGEFVPTPLDPVEGQLQCNMCALAVEKLESIMAQGGDQMDLAKLSLQVICDSMYSAPNLYLFCSSVINKILKVEDPKEVCRAIPKCFVVDEPVLNDTIIDFVNKDMERAIAENSGDYWEATRNPMFEGISLSEAKNYLGLLDDLTPFENMIIPEGDAQDIPTSFDSRTQWKDCIHAVRNQGACGSCWAVSGVDILSDRYCIKSNGSTNILLSAQDLVSCDKTNWGCQGGFLKNTWNYLANTGAVLESCFPYKSTSGTSPACPTYAVCPSGVGTWKRYKSKFGSTARYATLSAIQNEILTNGPVQAAFTVYQDFYSYRSGIYSYKTGKVVGGHAVRLVGWGVSSGTPYWIVANSWGKNWGGLSGYFWIKRGVNMCGFEASIYAGQAP